MQVPSAGSSPESELPAAQQTSTGECPWPFIWTHDVAAAMDPKHASKNLAVVVAIVSIIVSWRLGFF